MGDAVDADEKLFARAAAAFTEAQRLIAENRALQSDILFSLRRMVSRAIFHPHSVKLYSPLDFLQPLRPPRPFSNEGDHDPSARMTRSDWPE